MDVFLWPLLAVLLERALYDAKNSSDRAWYRIWRRRKASTVEEQQLPPGTAVSIRNLHKTFRTSFWRPKKSVVLAVDDLSLDIPKGGIFVLLGSNGYVQSSCAVGNELKHCT